jgi:hypothetical protein
LNCHYTFEAESGSPNAPGLENKAFLRAGAAGSGGWTPNMGYDPLLALFDRAVQDRFVRPEHRDLVLADTDVDALLERLASFKPIKIHKLFGRTN